MGLLPAAAAPRLVRAGGAHPTRAVGGIVRDVAQSGTRTHDCSANAVPCALRERHGLRAVMAEIVGRGSKGVGRRASSAREIRRKTWRARLHATVCPEGRAQRWFGSGYSKDRAAVAA